MQMQMQIQLLLEMANEARPNACVTVGAVLRDADATPLVVVATEIARRCCGCCCSWAGVLMRGRERGLG